MKKRTYGILIVALLLLVSVVAFAQNRSNLGMDRPFPSMRQFDIPDLTTEQLSQIEDLRMEHQKEIIPLRADLKVEEIKLEEMVKENSSANKIEKQIDKIGELRNELMKKQVQHRIAIRNLLTEEQKAAMDLRKHKRPTRHDRVPRGNRGFEGRMEQRR